MTERFSWRATGEPTGAVTFRRLTAQFGDGYRQVVGDGINTEVQSWPVTFAGGKQEMQAVAALLRRHAGVRSFFWTPPLGEEGLYEAPSFSLAHIGGDVYRVSATFQQVFKP